MSLLNKIMNLNRKIKLKKRIEREKLDASLKQYKLKQDIYGQLQEEGLRKLAKDKQKAVVEDTQDRAINDILISHQQNLKELANSIYVAKETNFKAAADSLHAKISEIEARRALNKIMAKKYKKHVKKFLNREEERTHNFMGEYQKIDFLNNMHNPYYVPPISGIGAMSLGNTLRRDMHLFDNDDS